MDVEIEKKIAEFLNQLSYEGDEHSTVCRESVKMVSENGKQKIVVKYLCNRNNFRNAPREMHIKALNEKMQNDVIETAKVKNENVDQYDAIKNLDTVEFLLHLYPYIEGEPYIEKYTWHWSDKTNTFEQ